MQKKAITAIRNPARLIMVNKYIKGCGSKNISVRFLTK
jgi:hypothetical protein